MRALFPLLLVTVFALGACDSLPSWVGGPKQAIKRAPGKRVDVIVNANSLKADPEAQEVTIDIPEPVGTEEWASRNEGMLPGHIGLTGLTKEQSARVGEGAEFSRNQVPQPIVVGGFVVAMDAAGAVSAHPVGDIDDVAWVNEDAVNDEVDDVLGGGLAYAGGVIYATTGYGYLTAIDLKTGKKIWKISVGAPVRGAPAIEGNMVVVLTADNQTLAFDAATGGPRWEHRGIRESAGYFATTAPVVSEGIVIAAYSSGEIFAIRAESGSVLWSDTVTTSDKTRASATFSGIDADPIVQDGVVVTTSAGGLMQASALINGRPLWQAKIGSHMTPWSAGNALFVITDTHDIAAVLKRDGAVRWAKSLMELDTRDQDATPVLLGPIVAGNAVLVVSSEGELSAYRPQDGKLLKHYELSSGVATTPVIANGAMFLVTQDATLHKYY